MVNFSCVRPFALVLGFVSIGAVAYTAPVESRVDVDSDEGWVQQSQPSTSQDTDQQYVSAQTSEQASASGPSYLARLSDLEDEVRQLRGQVEEQNHKLKQMVGLQTKIFQDLDSRVTKLSGGNRAGHDSTKLLEAKAGALEQKPPLTRSVSVDPANEQKSYQTAYDLLRNKQYAQAKLAMKDYVTNYPDGEFAVNAHYWLGELNLLTGDSKTAAKEFNTVIEKYPTSNKVSDAMLKTGLIYLEQDNQKAAKQQFQKIMQSFPNSASAGIAKRRLQQL